MNKINASLIILGVNFEYPFLTGRSLFENTKLECQIPDFFNYDIALRRFLRTRSLSLSQY